MSDVPPPTHPDEVSLTEAARLLGVSSSTVRRLVKTGKLNGRTVPTARGFAYRVQLPDAQPPVPQPVKERRPPYGARARNAVSEALAPLVEQIAALTREVAELRAQLTTAQEPKGHTILPPVVDQPPLPGELTPRNRPSIWWRRFSLSE
jgi:helix-turn-helix protein